MFRKLKDSSDQPGAIAEKDGVHFGYYASGTAHPELILYRKGTEEIAARIPFPEPCGPGNFYRMKLKLRASAYEYNYYEDGTIVVDPYARKIAGRGAFGSEPSESAHRLRGGFLTKQFDWGEDQRPGLLYDEAVMYHLHVRGFTKSKNSGVRKKGTFAGVREKLPYLKELGINQIKLMPCYEFDEAVPKVDWSRMSAAQKAAAQRNPGGSLNGETLYKMNYWGYGPGFYFAPKASYAASSDADLELKELVKAAHQIGIEVLMEFYFTEDTDILMMGQCLNYWAEEYHLDGFSVMARGGVPGELARLPLFRTVKLICEWYPEQTVEKNAEKQAAALLAESNDGFMNDCRRLLKGDEGMTYAFADRLRRNPKGCAVINYITNHDGFTLEDLVSYDHKHNKENKEQERDGTDYNCSWNCGVEGPSRKKEIRMLRMRQKKNALAMVLFAQGTPMLLAGDEFGNSQNGNNNPYCHDSVLTWLDWSHSKSSRELTAFVKHALYYRGKHKMLHQSRELCCSDSRADGYPDVSYHGSRAWYWEFDRTSRHIGCLYAGSYAGESGFIYIAYNLHWSRQELALPLLPKELSWFKVMDTSLEQSFLEEEEELGRVKTFEVPPRTIIILEGKAYGAVRTSESDHME